MKMYIETIFIVNFLLDYMILYGTKKILKRSTKWTRLFLGSCVGSLTTLILFIPITNIELGIIKGILSILMNWITFGKKDLKNSILYFYSISIILGGSIYLLDIQNKKSYLILFLISFLTIKTIIKEMTKYKEKYPNKYFVRIYYQNKHYDLEGFIDTGNQLISPYKKEKIILVNLNLSSNNLLYVPYKALNTRGIIPCIRPDRVEVNQIECKNCLIGLVKDKFDLKEIDCILPNKLKEELC